MKAQINKPYITIPLFALIVLALSFGCARAPLNLPAQEMKSLDYEATGVEAFKAQDFQRALSKFKEALRLNASIDNRRGMVFDLINLGRVSVELGLADAALDYLSRAETLALAVNDDKLLSEAIAASAKALLWKGDKVDIETARARLSRSIEIDSKTGVRSGGKLNLMAAISVEAGEYAEAARQYEAALKVNEGNSDELEAANSLRAMSTLSERAGNSAEAILLRAKAYDLDRKSGDAVKIMDDLRSLAKLYDAAGNRGQALFHYARLYDAAAANDLTQTVRESLTELVRLSTETGDVKAAEDYKRILESVADNGAQK